MLNTVTAKTVNTEMFSSSLRQNPITEEWIIHFFA